MISDRNNCKIIKLANLSSSRKLKLLEYYQIYSITIRNNICMRINEVDSREDIFKKIVFVFERLYLYLYLIFFKASYLYLYLKNSTTSYLYLYSYLIKCI